MSYAEWKRLLEFGGAPPFFKELQSGLDTLQESNNSFRRIVSLARSVLSVSSRFITGTTDSLSSAINQYAILFKSILQNVASLGGQFIVIHPWNRFHKKTVAINSDSMYPIRFPSLSPSEAFKELYQSFENTKDKMRPRYGSDTKVTGFGFLIACQTPHDLAKTINAVRYFFNMKELEEMIEKYRSQLTNQVNDLLSQNKIEEANKLALESENLFKIKFKNGFEFETKDHVLPEWWEYSKNKEPRWLGFSIINFPFVAQTVYQLQSFVDDLTKISETTNDAIKMLVNSILKKVDHLISIIDEFYSFLISILQSLQLTNVYFFKIPPHTGGLNYMYSAIQSSIMNPSGDGKYVRQIWNSAQFSTLIFFSSGIGVDYNKWYDSIVSIWETFLEKSGKIAIESVQDYWKLARKENDFYISHKKYIVSPSTLQDNTIYKLNDEIMFKILSSDTALYFSYTLYLSDRIISQFISTSSHKALMNKASFTFKFTEEGDYRLQITVKSETDANFVEYRNIKFYVRSSISDRTPMIPAPIKKIPLTNTQIGALVATDTETGIQEKYYVYKPTDPIEVGGSFPDKESRLRIVFTDSRGNQSLDFPFLLKKDTPFIYLKTIPSVIYVESYPTSIYFDFEAIFYLYDISLGESQAIYVSMPNLLIVYKDSEYQYKYHVQDGVFSNWLNLKIQKRTKGYKDIC